MSEVSAATPGEALIASTALADLSCALGTSRLRENVPLAPFTTFRIGGPADLFVEPESADELAQAILAARASGIPWFLLGLGANVLIGDRGFRGLVIRNGARRIEIDPAARTIRAESGAVVYPGLIDAAIAAGLSGLEHYVGIPSTVGGALWQNLHFLAPAPERERTMFIAEVTEGAEILTESGERKTVDNAYFEFGYDQSILHHRRDVVLHAT
ncbi:MAG TPA: FAD-binding protein, partial [Thermoanaerobaculia bacterium]|nr:FAD-binding protein [Thermoanaerobaculia bacterium]